MFWEIHGYRQGQPFRARVTADSAEAARAVAEAHGVIVQGVQVMAEGPQPVMAVPDAGVPLTMPATPTPIPVAVSYASNLPTSETGPAMGLGIAALVCGGLGTICCHPVFALLLGTAGLALGITGWAISKKNIPNNGRGIAIAGTMVSALPFLLWAVLSIGLVVMFNRFKTAAATAAAAASSAAQTPAPATTQATSPEPTEDSAADGNSQNAPLVISAQGLITAFTSDLESADSAYKGRWVRVQGHVSRIRDQAVYLAENSSELHPVECSIYQPGSIQLNIGQQVTVVGRCMGMSHYITVRDGRIVKDDGQ